MNSLPMHLLDNILFRLDLKSLVMMQCTNRSIKSHISDDPSFEIGYSSRAQLSFIYTFSKGAPFVFYQPFGSQCESDSYVKTYFSTRGHSYILGSCSGHLLLYKSGLYVVNPLTKRFRLLDHSGSMLLATIFNGPKANPERSMCVGFALDQTRPKGFKIVCILEIHATYAFEISDGNSWRFSETIITTDNNSKNELTKRMKPVYLDGTLHWFRNDGSIIAFNIETEQARLIPSVFHKEPEMKLFFTIDDKINRLTLISGTKETISVYTLMGDTSKWALARQIENVLLTDGEFEYWNVIAYDGKHMVVRDKEKDGSTGLAHVYNMEDNRWGGWWAIFCQAKYNLDVFRFTHFLSCLEDTEVVVDSTDGHLVSIMRLIDTTRTQVNKLHLHMALQYNR
ncbi:unnamed protein product [Eruca vesicaria subsp. sativa]|uniref:F-box domain-containing protein n=1 Tax=Eruca vesicaria subsp. sativa TaxID=29727 RepID=A0ABC8KM38_ERUVS|nr:unnamed protein product [Eruca vesicaria subsp. sativa]